jgi:hypothetical protein
MKAQVLCKVAAAAMTVALPALAQTATPPAPPTAPAAAQTPLSEDAVAALDKVCLPVLRGAMFKAAAATAGFKFKDDAWSRPVDSQHRVEIDPPDVANPHLCTVSVTYAAGDGAQLRAAMSAWASAQSPPLSPVQVGQIGAGSDLTTSQWTGKTAGGFENVVLSQEHAAKGAGGGRQSTLEVSFTPT